jgi:hypothetical protein
MRLAAYSTAEMVILLDFYSLLRKCVEYYYLYSRINTLALNMGRYFE